MGPTPPHPSPRVAVELGTKKPTTEHRIHSFSSALTGGSEKTFQYWK